MRSPLSSLPRLFLSAILTVLAFTAADAQSYPTGLIRIVVPSAAGTPPDIITRIVASALEKNEGWRIVVENKPGAIQTLGAAEVLKHPADGHTIMAVAMSSTAAAALLPAVSFTLARDFIPVVETFRAHHVVVVHPSVPATSLPELVALLKSQPDKFNFSSGGFGTPAHLGGEMFRVKTAIRATHVPYPALPAAIRDLLNGNNHYQFITPLPVLGLIETGKLRALAVTGPKRLAALPQIPTVIEAGFPELIIQDWGGYLVKAGTPQEVVTRLNTAINTALSDPSVKEAITKLGAEATGGSASDFSAFVAAQTAHWEGVVKAAGIRMNQ